MAMKRLILALFVLFTAQQAHAVSLTLDCRSVGLTSGFIEQERKIWQFGKLLWYAKKYRVDVYKMLASSTLGHNDIQTVWGGLMCQANQVGDQPAVLLRNRWSEAIGFTLDGFTIARAQAYFLQRLKEADDDQTVLLSPDKRQLLVDTLGYMSTLGGPYPAIQQKLTAALGL
jgi:hypothetical protein